MKKTIGFIGCGNMAQAMIKGIIEHKILTPNEVIASDAYRAGLEKAHETLGIVITDSNKEVAENADIIVFAGVYFMAQSAKLLYTKNIFQERFYKWLKIWSIPSPWNSKNPVSAPVNSPFPSALTTPRAKAPKS